MAGLLRDVVGSGGRGSDNRRRCEGHRPHGKKNLHQTSRHHRAARSIIRFASSHRVSRLKNARRSNRHHCCGAER